MRFLSKEAQIKTASVEIKIVTISGKQVTLSVFRQIEEDDLWYKDGILIGEPWGIINYCPGEKNCKGYSEGKHDHILWQKGEELRRCWDTHRRTNYTIETFKRWLDNEIIDCKASINRLSQSTEDERRKLFYKDRIEKLPNEYKLMVDQYFKMKEIVMKLPQLFIAV